MPNRKKNDSRGISAPSSAIPEWANDMWKAEIREKWAIRNSGEALAGFLRLLDAYLCKEHDEANYPQHERVAVALAEWEALMKTGADNTVSDGACAKAVKEVLG